MVNSLSLKKIFREFNSLVTSLVKPLLSRNIYQKSCGNFTAKVFSQKFRQINVLLLHSVENTEILSHTFLANIS